MEFGNCHEFGQDGHVLLAVTETFPFVILILKQKENMDQINQTPIKCVMTVGMRTQLTIGI